MWDTNNHCFAFARGIAFTCHESCIHIVARGSFWAQSFFCLLYHVCIPNLSYYCLVGPWQLKKGTKRVVEALVFNSSHTFYGANGRIIILSTLVALSHPYGVEGRFVCSLLQLCWGGKCKWNLLKTLKMPCFQVLSLFHSSTLVLEYYVGEKNHLQTSHADQTNIIPHSSYLLHLQEVMTHQVYYPTQQINSLSHSKPHSRFILDVFE